MPVFDDGFNSDEDAGSGPAVPRAKQISPAGAGRPVNFGFDDSVIPSSSNEYATVWGRPASENARRSSSVPRQRVTAQQVDDPGASWQLAWQDNHAGVTPPTGSDVHHAHGTVVGRQVVGRIVHGPNGPVQVSVNSQMQPQMLQHVVQQNGGMTPLASPQGSQQTLNPQHMQNAHQGAAILGGTISVPNMSSGTFSSQIGSFAGSQQMLNTEQMINWQNVLRTPAGSQQVANYSMQMPTPVMAQHIIQQVPVDRVVPVPTIVDSDETAKMRKALQAAILQITTLKAQLKRAYAGFEQVVQPLKGYVNRLSDEIEDLKDENESLRKQIHGLRNENESLRNKPAEYREVEVIKQVPVQVDKIIEVPVEKIVNVEVPKIVYETKYIEIPVDKIVEKAVFVDREVPIEKIVEKIVEVPVEKIVYRTPKICGVGMLLGRFEDSHQLLLGNIFVLELVPGGPAFHCEQIQVNDILFKVDQQPVKGWSLDQVAELIKGEEGSPITLEFGRQNSEGKMNKFRLTLFRGEIDGSSAGARGVAGRSSTLGVGSFQASSSSHTDRMQSSHVSSSRESLDAGMDTYTHRDRNQAPKRGASVSHSTSQGAGMVADMFAGMVQAQAEGRAGTYANPGMTATAATSRVSENGLNRSDSRVSSVSDTSLHSFTNAAAMTPTPARAGAGGRQVETRGGGGEGARVPHVVPHAPPSPSEQYAHRNGKPSNYTSVPPSYMGEHNGTVGGWRRETTTSERQMHEQQRYDDSDSSSD